MTEGTSMWMRVRCKATPPYSPALYNPAILLLIYYLIIRLLNNTPQANDYTFVDRLIIYEGIWFSIRLPLYGFFISIDYYCLLLYYLDWLLAGLSRLSLYHLFVLHQSLSNQYILWLSLQSSKALLLISIFPDIP